MRLALMLQLDGHQNPFIGLQLTKTDSATKKRLGGIEEGAFCLAQCHLRRLQQLAFFPDVRQMLRRGLGMDNKVAQVDQRVLPARPETVQSPGPVGRSPGIF